MRVEVTPRRFSVVLGRPFPVTVRVTNTSSVISGHEVRVLGLDPAWVRLDKERLSLFPDASGVIVVTLELPLGLPAGLRKVEIEVRELTSPGEVALVEIELAVPSHPELSLSLDQSSITGTTAASVGFVVSNEGNSPLQIRLEGTDDEAQVRFRFQPEAPSLDPGERLLGTLELKAKRPFVGSPKIRPFSIKAGSPQAPSVASGVFVQRPRLTRGNLALFGLIAAATVFAVVLSAALSQVVGESNANRDLALQVAEASQSRPSGGVASIAGTVSELTSKAPLSGVTVDLYKASSPSQPVVSTSTGRGGGYHFSGLSAGSYKLSFDAAGFTELWYPDALGARSAGTVTLSASSHLQGVDIELGGAPATISGQVTGASSAGGVVLTLELPGSRSAVPTIVLTRTLPASGVFRLTGVPSPAIYELVATEPGYAPSSQLVSLGGGEDRSGVTIALRKGDGSIAGTVFSPTGPLGGATIAASSGTTTLDTVSATTKGEVGTFLLTSLPTPSTLSLVVSAPGYAPATLSVSLAPAQQVRGIAITLQPGVGSISGHVLTPPGTPTGGVTVSASNGTANFTTTTLSSGAAGSYRLEGLPVPGTYTVTFSRPDLASQTQEVSLPAVGDTNLQGVDVSMVANVASVSGTVSGPGGTGVGEVAVSLVSGQTTYQVLTATQPTPGAFAIEGIAPGTYNLSFTRQGGAPTSLIIHLSAGEHLLENERLSAAASIMGYVVDASTGEAVPGAEVSLYESSQYPAVVVAETTTDAKGAFVFDNVVAPQSYVVAVSYPKGSSPQETVQVTTSPGVATPACGSAGTGLLPSPTTTTTPTTTTSSTPALGARSGSGATRTCNPALDPLEVRLS
jgi:5-hydroxyisourate hydrolase-like protein (transthyretin family)